MKLIMLFAAVLVRSVVPFVPSVIDHSEARMGTDPIVSLSKKPTELPFPMIVSQKEIKEALILAAVNPKITGVLLSGRHGTGKSVLARAARKLLPDTICRVKGSVYNVDPTGEDGMDSILYQQLLANNTAINELETEDWEMPFVQVPLGVMEDGLIGTVDIEESIKSGETVFSPGLLARAHRGILHIDDINLLDEDILNILFDIVSDGWVTVEKEGVSVRYPCRPFIIATWNPDEGDITKHFTDRIAISLSANMSQLSTQDRVEVVNNVLCFSGDVEKRDRAKCQLKMHAALDKEKELRNAIISARESVAKVIISRDQIHYICEEASRAGCEGQRGEIFATQLAKASAAINKRRMVSAEDLRKAIRLAIAPRSKFFNQEDSDISEHDESSADTGNRDDFEGNMPPMAPPPGEYEEPESNNSSEKKEQDIVDEQDQNQELDPDVIDDKEQTELLIPEQFMFGVDMIPIDPEILNFAQSTKKGKGGKRSSLFNLERGKYVKPVFPKGGQHGLIAVGATLRAAAPYQNIRRRLAEDKAAKKRAVYVDKDDFRIKRMSRKAGALIIFVVDASGSMALNRMDAAKGAAISLLSEAYKARDKICLISFQETQAMVLVPPTKSIVLTKSRLESMPCGGGSPLAHALTIAARVGINEKQIKKDVGRVIIVLLTDGRANVPMAISLGEFNAATTSIPTVDGRPTKEYLHEEVVKCASALRLEDFNVLVIDTEDKFIATGCAQEIAKASLGHYCQIDPRDSEAIEAVTKRSILKST